MWNVRSIWDGGPRKFTSFGKYRLTVRALRAPRHWGGGDAAITESAHVRLRENDLKGSRRVRFGFQGGIAATRQDRPVGGEATSPVGSLRGSPYRLAGRRQSPTWA